MDWRDKIADWLSGGAVTVLDRQNKEFRFHIQRAARKQIALMKIMQITAVKNQTSVEKKVREIARDAIID